MSGGGAADTSIPNSSAPSAVGSGSAAPHADLHEPVQPTKWRKKELALLSFSSTPYFHTSIYCKGNNTSHATQKIKTTYI
jgi:hypothetical protein